MNKSELVQKLIESITEKHPELTEKAVIESVDILFEKMVSTLQEKGRIEIRGFGSFALRYQAARKAHNPKTKEKLISAPKYKLHFKPAKRLRARINCNINK